MNNEGESQSQAKRDIGEAGCLHKTSSALWLAIVWWQLSVGVLVVEQDCF